MSARIVLAIAFAATSCGHAAGPAHEVGGRIDPLETIAIIVAADPNAYAPLAPGEHLRQEIFWEWEAAEGAVLWTAVGLWRAELALSLSWQLLDDTNAVASPAVVGGSPFSETMYPLGGRPVCACRVGEPVEGLFVMLLEGAGAEPDSVVLIALPRPTPEPIPEAERDHGVRYLLNTRLPLRVVARYELHADHPLERVRILEPHPSGDVLRVTALERVDSACGWEVDLRDARLIEARRSSDEDRGSR